MTHMLSLLPKSRFEESGVEIPGGLAFLADYRPDAIAEASAGIEGLFMAAFAPPPRRRSAGPARLRAHHPDGRGRIRQRGPRGGGEARPHRVPTPRHKTRSPWQSIVIGAVICLQLRAGPTRTRPSSPAPMRRHGNASSAGAPANCSAPPWASSGSAASAGAGPRLAAFGATVVASDVFWPEDFAQEHGIRRVNLDELFAVSDIVTLHCPLMDATRGLVDAARLASMKPRRDPRQRGARRHCGRNGPCGRPRTRRHPRRGHR